MDGASSPILLPAVAAIMAVFPFVPWRAGIPPVPSLPAREPARAMSRLAFPASAAALALRRGS